MLSGASVTFSLKPLNGTRLEKAASHNWVTNSWLLFGEEQMQVKAKNQTTHGAGKLQMCFATIIVLKFGQAQFALEP